MHRDNFSFMKHSRLIGLTDRKFLKITCGVVMYMCNFLNNVITFNLKFFLKQLSISVCFVLQVEIFFLKFVG